MTDQPQPPAEIDVVVSGHLCLDLIPAMDSVPLNSLASPGKLFEMGALDISTGGSVSNTGLALHRLGADVRLLSNVGDDLLGRVIIAFLKDRDPRLADHIAVEAGQSSSYSMLLSPQKVDRIILHGTGTNETFSPENIDLSLLDHAKIFFLGYPPLLPALITAEGAPLHKLYQEAKRRGVTTAMDMVMPDPNKPSGQVNWPAILRGVLPFTDIFIPSIEEILFMLRRADYDAWKGQVYAHLTRDYLRALADEIIALGAVITGFKLGELGIYLRTAPADSFARLKRLSLDVTAWADVELWHPAFEVDVVGTTGAGDSAYAAFMVALLHHLPPADALQVACAVGAANIEYADATSGVPTWAAVRERIRAGWQHKKNVLPGYTSISNQEN